MIGIAGRGSFPTEYADCYADLDFEASPKYRGGTPLPRCIYDDLEMAFTTSGSGIIRQPLKMQAKST
jgi:hypothetical protein